MSSIKELKKGLEQTAEIFGIDGPDAIGYTLEFLKANPSDHFAWRAARDVLMAVIPGLPGTDPSEVVKALQEIDLLHFSICNRGAGEHFIRE